MDSLTSESAPTPENPNSLKDFIYELFQPENLRHSWPWTIFFMVMYSIIFVMGISGNFIVIFVYCRRRQMRSITNMFIVNLAVADLFVILFCVPVTLISNIFVPWILGTFICKAAAYIQGISVFASAYSLAAISAERCKGIYRFKPVINNLTKLQALLIITLIWTTAFLILLPWPIVFEVTPVPQTGPTLFCLENWTNERTGNIYFLFGNLISCYAIPGILMCITNSQVCRKVSQRKVPIGSASPGYVTHYHQRVKSGVKKMLSLVTFTFLLSWLPLYVVMCRVKFTSIQSMSETELDILNKLIPIVQLLGSSNSCINPVLYAYMNSRFREMFMSVFYIPINCSFSCRQRYQRRSSSQKSLIVFGKNLANYNIMCTCINGKAQCNSQNSSISTSSSSLTQKSEVYRCKNNGVLCNKKYQAHVKKFACIRHTEIRLFKYSRETSV